MNKKVNLVVWVVFVLVASAVAVICFSALDSADRGTMAAVLGSIALAIGAGSAAMAMRAWFDGRMSEYGEP